MKTDIPIIELDSYWLASAGSGNGLREASFSLFRGDVCAIESDSTEDAALFLRALATLIQPRKGTYRFDGRKIDLDDYRNSLDCKRRIGYIASDAALISNRTLEDNLLLMRKFHEDSIALDLDARTAALCRKFDLIDKLDQRPADLPPRQVQNAITVRELAKQPEVLVLDRPEDFVDHARFDFFLEIVKSMIRAELTTVYYSSDNRMGQALANRKVDIRRGRLRAGGREG